MTNISTKYPIGFTCGAFDLLHAGHLLMLKEMAEKCEYVVVGLQLDPSIDRPEKKSPVESMEERKIRLEACRYVDEIVYYTTEEHLYQILQAHPEYTRFLGADWQSKEYTGHDLPNECVFTSRDHNFSSTNLRTRIEEKKTEGEVKKPKKKLSIVIMAHPKRHIMAKELSAKLGNVPIVWDMRNNLWDTCRRAWLTTDPDAEYCLVLQDDAIVPDNFIELAEARLAESEDRVYSFYAGKMLGSRIDKARAEGKDHLLEHMIYNEIALCMRSERVEPMVAFCDDKGAQNDQEINNYAGENGVRIKYVLPSLVDHQETESIYRGMTGFNPGDGVRKAYWYIGHEK